MMPAHALWGTHVGKGGGAGAALRCLNGERPSEIDDDGFGGAACTQQGCCRVRQAPAVQVVVPTVPEASAPSCSYGTRRYGMTTAPERHRLRRIRAG